MGIINGARRVHIVQIKAVNGIYHAVVQEGTHEVLASFDTQEAAIDWAESESRPIIDIHRERNMKPGDEHGQFRHA